jgi:hypothetical protein
MLAQLLPRGAGFLSKISDKFQMRAMGFSHNEIGAESRR